MGGWRRVALALIMMGASSTTLNSVQAQQAELPRTVEWAFPVNPPGFQLTPDDGRTLIVPDSETKYKVSDVRNAFLAPDWRPRDHPPMPEIVAHGRKPAVLACGYCHRATGSGGVENAPIAGLPETYFVQQLKDFQSGMRTGAVPERAPLKYMIASAKAATDDEIALAAAYFSGLKQRKLYRVVESDVAPKTVVYNWAPIPLQSGEKNLLGCVSSRSRRNLNDSSRVTTGCSSMSTLRSVALQRARRSFRAAVEN